MLSNRLDTLKKSYEHYMNEVKDIKEYFYRWTFTYNNLEVEVVDFIEDGWLVVIESVNGEYLDDDKTMSYLYLDEVDEDLKTYKKKGELIK